MSGKLSANQLIQKAIDEDNLPNSTMSRQQANRFIDLVVDTSVLLKQIRVSRIDHAKGEINKLDLGSIVTEGASATTSATTRTPTDSVVEYDTVKYRSAFDLTSDFMEDNLEGTAIRDRVLEMFSKRIAIDTEMAAIEGDSSLTTGDAQSDENNLLGVNDGFNKILTTNVPAGQQVDAAGAASSLRLFYALRRAIPARYRVAKPSYRWCSPSSVYDKWMLDTAELGVDAAVPARNGVVQRNPFGTKMIEVPLMPEDLAYGTAVTDATKIWLTPLQNLIYFIQRAITIEWDRVPRSDKWEVTIHFRADFAVENADMVVIAKNVSESGSNYTG